MNSVTNSVKYEENRKEPNNEGESSNAEVIEIRAVAEDFKETSEVREIEKKVVAPDDETKDKHMNNEMSNVKNEKKRKEPNNDE